MFSVSAAFRFPLLTNLIMHTGGEGQTARVKLSRIEWNIVLSQRVGVDLTVHEPL